MAKEINTENVYSYFLGWYRYQLYYRFGKKLIRNHILEQIEYRIKVMNEECFNSGSCVECGCSTTALQMCNKSCDGNCYGPMLPRREWQKFKLKNLSNE